MEQTSKDIGALWVKTSKAGKTYLSGTIQGQRVVVFRNERKQEGERTPDWRVYPDTPRETAPVEQIHTALTSAVRQVSDVTGDDIPF